MNEEELNARLRSFYQSKWNDLVDLTQPYEGISHPLLLHVFPAYCKAKVPLMIVGQQTRSWYGNFTEHTTPSSIDPIIRNYEGFKLGKHMRGSPFWQAARKLNGMLNPNGDGLDFLWSNLFKVDQHKIAANRALRQRLPGLGMLQEEIRITSPTAIVFFTGHENDGFLSQSFPNSRPEALAGSGYSAQELSRIVNDGSRLLPYHAYRTYHPNFFRMRRKWSSHLVPILHRIVQEVNGRN